MGSCSGIRPRPVRTTPARILAGLLLAFTGACAYSPTPYRDASQGGYEVSGVGGFQVTEVSPSIYRIEAAGSRVDSVDRIRSMALLKASEITLSKGAERFRIVGGQGFSSRPDVVVGALGAVPMGSRAVGDIQIRILSKADRSDADTVNAREYQDRTAPLFRG